MIASVRSNPREVLKGPLARAEKGGAKIAREDELARLRPRQRHNPASEQQGPCLKLRRHALAREAVAQLRQPQRARRHQRGAPARRPRRGSRRRKRGGSGVERRRGGGPATTTGVRDCRGSGCGGCRGRRLQHSGDAAAQVSRLAQEAGGVREVVCGDARELEASEELVVELEPVRRLIKSHATMSQHASSGGGVRFSRDGQHAACDETSIRSPSVATVAASGRPTGALASRCAFISSAASRSTPSSTAPTPRLPG